MILFEGLVQEITLSKDGTRKYVEFADREHFVTYRIGIPPETQLSKGEITQLEITKIRAFNSQISLEGQLPSKPSLASGKA